MEAATDKDLTQDHLDNVQQISNLSWTQHRDVNYWQCLGVKS